MSRRTSACLLILVCGTLFLGGLIAGEAWGTPYVYEKCEYDGFSFCSQHPCNHTNCAALTGKCQPETGQPLGYCAPHWILWCDHGASCDGYCENSSMTRSCSCALGNGWCD